jgi:activating signal cointegrator 1
MAMIYKAISIKQPFAALIACGKKKIEIRSRLTHYRGELLIVSSLKPTMKKFIFLPLGQAVALVKLVDCREMRLEDSELAFCEYEPGAYSWILENPKSVSPFPVKGALGFYSVTHQSPLIFFNPPDFAEIEAVARQE